MRILCLISVLCMGASTASAQQGSPERPICSLTRCTPSEQRFSRSSLAKIQKRGNIAPDLLKELIHNPSAKPFLPKALNALGKVDRMPGTLDVVSRLAHAHDEGSARGAAFEIFAGAALKKNLRRLSTVVKGNEWDGELRDGTVVSMKSITTPSDKGVGNVLRHATKQLIRRTQDGRAAMLVIGHEPNAKIRKNWSHMAKRLGTDLSVVLVQHKTGRYRTVFTTLNKNPLAADPTKVRPVNKRPATKHQVNRRVAGTPRASQRQARKWPMRRLRSR